MKTGRSLAKVPKNIQKSRSQKFKDISKYFSEEEWAKLRYTEKVTYVYLKRNYDTMIGLGLRATLPPFMCPKKKTTKPCGSDSHQDQGSQNEDKPLEGPSNMQEMQNLKAKKVMPKKPAKAKYDCNTIPVTSGAKQDEKQLCLLEAAGNSGQQRRRTSRSKNRKSSIWAHRLRERNIPIVYEEISDPEEDD